MRIVGVLLAAGQGTRFGGDKLLARLADGTPVGVMAARNLAAALHEVIAVVRPEDVRLAELLGAAGIAVEPCPSAWQGMGSSLAHAVRARADADGWIVALADMPKVRPETIRAVAGALEDGAPLVAPVHRGERGHPVGFAAAYGARVAALSGDAGAREILRAERDRIVLIECDDPGVVADIDTVLDLERFKTDPPRS
ncbi:MAG: NTP transferase domain-containing protein [Betaproteobacteria bacterium]|nr:NTP transferase domain-containing protein [Betaproteobacteria bacterium]